MLRDNWVQLRDPGHSSDPFVMSVDNPMILVVLVLYKLESHQGDGVNSKQLEVCDLRLGEHLSNKFVLEDLVTPVWEICVRGISHSFGKTQINKPKRRHLSLTSTHN